MRTSTSMRWLVVAVSAAMLLAVAAACAGETVEVPGETVVVEKVVTETVEVPGETVVVEKEVIRTVEVPGETVTKEVVKEVMVPGETVVVEKEVVKTVEVPGETVVKEVVKTVEVPGETVVVEKEVVKTVEVPGQTVVVEKEVVKTVEVPGPERVVIKEVSGKNYVTDPVTGKVFTAPEYGGTLTFARGNDTAPGDTWFGAGEHQVVSGVVEKLGIGNWALDKDIYPFIGGAPAPVSALTGALAESWDISPDGLTYTFHIRQGVHWHDKPPMNGRELTAQDVEFNFHRMLGNKLTGTEFSEAEPSPAAGSLGALPLESVTATDTWTVVMKLKEPRLNGLETMLDGPKDMFIQPPEVIEQYGDISDWRNIVGTGPYMITDFVPDSSITWTKNPNYWGFDEKYPENRLPYIDELKGLYMTESATMTAALRSGQIDYRGWTGTSQIRIIDEAESLRRTNPELVFIPYATRTNHATKVNTSRAPFDDIRVRQAMQMALDLETINATFFKGLADTTPQGLVGREFTKGYYVPFEEWPEEIKQYHRYDPEGANKLLDEAGLPRGADGIRFKKTYLAWAGTGHAIWAELLDGYWREIGIQIDILDMPPAEVITILQSGNWDMWIGSTANVNPIGQMNQPYGGATGWWHIPQHDAQYDALYEEMLAATTIEQQRIAIREMDMRFNEQFWVIWRPKAPEFTVHQPWVMGYNGEHALGAAQFQPTFARLWIDSQLKAAMGR